MARRADAPDILRGVRCTAPNSGKKQTQITANKKETEQFGKSKKVRK